MNDKIYNIPQKISEEKFLINHEIVVWLNIFEVHKSFEGNLFMLKLAVGSLVGYCTVASTTPKISNTEHDKHFLSIYLSLAPQGGPHKRGDHRYFQKVLKLETTAFLTFLTFNST